MYLIIDNADGYPARPMLVDGSPWQEPVVQAGRIQPGRHWIGCCGGEIGFDVRPGVVNRFNYWGSIGMPTGFRLRRFTAIIGNCLTSGLPNDPL
jgi:hypothetical protein